jgi:hypothetical protein
MTSNKSTDHYAQLMPRGAWIDVAAPRICPCPPPTRRPDLSATRPELTLYEHGRLQTDPASAWRGAKCGFAAPQRQPKRLRDWRS